MENIKIHISVPRSVALAEGQPRYGESTYEPTSDELAGLSAEERAALDPATQGVRFGLGLTTATVTWAAIVAALRARIAGDLAKQRERDAEIEAERASYRTILASERFYEPGLPLQRVKHDVRWDGAPNYSNKDAEARELWARVEAARKAQRRERILEADAALEYGRDGDRPAEPVRRVLESHRGGSFGDPEIATPRATELAERVRREVESERAAAEAEVRSLERDLLGGHGTAEQLERYDAGVMPVEEFEEVAVQVLFAPLADCAQYERLVDGDVEHSDECCDSEVRFATSVHDGPLSAEQWAALKQVRAAAPEGAEVEVRRHRGYCKSCDAEAIHLGARVTIQWAAEEYRQEYAL